MITNDLNESNKTSKRKRKKKNKNKKKTNRNISDFCTFEMTCHTLLTFNASDIFKMSWIEFIVCRFIYLLKTCLISVYWQKYIIEFNMKSWPFALLCGMICLSLCGRCLLNFCGITCLSFGLILFIFHNTKIVQLN